MASTHKFTLPSGRMCEVREMTGKHQKILTEKKSGNYADKLNIILADIIVRVGDETDINEGFVTDMLSVDRKAALVQCRHFSLGFPETFKFTYTFKGEFTLRDVDPETGDVKKTTYHEIKEEIEVPTPEFKITPYPGSAEWPAGAYKDIDRKRTIILPRSEKKVVFTLMDGRAEARAVGLTDTNSHTQLQLRTPVYMHKGANAEVPIQLDLDDLSLMDIEALRKAITDAEGDIDTGIPLVHPHKDLVEEKFATVRLDLIQEVSFFFPSQAT